MALHKPVQDWVALLVWTSRSTDGSPLLLQDAMTPVRCMQTAGAVLGAL